MEESKLKKLIEKEGLTLLDLKVMRRLLKQEDWKQDPERVFNLISNRFKGREVSVNEVKTFLQSINIVITSCSIGIILKPCYDQVIKKVNGKTTRLYIFE